MQSRGLRAALALLLVVGSNLPLAEPTSELAKPEAMMARLAPVDICAVSSPLRS